MNDRLSLNSHVLVQPRPHFLKRAKKGKSTGDKVDFVGKSLKTRSCQFCVPVFILDGTLWNVFGHIQIFSEPYRKFWHSQDKNVTPIA